MSGNGDYISREAAITTYKTFGHLNLHNAIEAFNEIPAADVRPVVRGKWKKEFRIIAGYGWYLCTCSRCGMTFKAFNSSNYCPNCGADMRPEEE